MIKQIFLLLACTVFIKIAGAQTTPDKLYGRFFHEVQMARVFTDSKTFVDCTPKKSPAEIVASYQKIISNPAIRFSIKLFTEENFEQPVTPQLNYITKEKDIQQHIKNLWGVLKRKSDTSTSTLGNSLLPLPYPYIVPGGRFREIYYWDSYFTMLGLKESGENDMIENMVKNFAYLIDSFGHIPNGNRTYYLSRSQPPFFSLMVELLASVKGDGVYVTYLPQLEKEYKYWMQGSEKLKPMQAERSVVKLKDGSLLNRYWDELDIPRQEAYYDDQTLAEKYPARAKKLNRDLRAAAASGWDFSSRWFADNKNISSIQTTNIIPIDLNCLLYKLELVIAKAKLVSTNDSTVAIYRKKASARLAAIDKYCWNKSITFYTDYNFVTQKQSTAVTPAGMYPFCFFTEKPDYMSLLARKVAEVVKTKLLKPGGIVTTENNTGQQWDAPNGWAPLQWMTIWGLDKCGQKELARDIAERWLKLNVDVFNRTGKLMEKYNVVDNKTEAGGGEYPSQDGFGWTNGVFLKLVSIYGMPQ